MVSKIYQVKKADCNDLHDIIPSTQNVCAYGRHVYTYIELLIVIISGRGRFGTQEVFIRY